MIQSIVTEVSHVKKLIKHFTKMIGAKKDILEL